MTTPLPATAADYFGAMVESYDSLIRRAVPRYDEMTQRLIEYLPGRASPRILDLGCGTGNLTLRLLRHYPGAAVTAVDAAREMTRVTAERAAAGQGTITAITSRFEDLDLAPASFDIITSCISLHHVRDKAALYRQLRRWLASDGTFRFADQLRGGTDELHAINWARWLEFCRQPGNCSEAETQSLIDHGLAHDHYTPLPEHFALLRDAGFTALDCVWRNWIWGIVTADT